MEEEWIQECGEISAQDVKEVISNGNPSRSEPHPKGIETASERFEEVITVKLLSNYHYSGKNAQKTFRFPTKSLL